MMARCMYLAEKIDALRLRVEEPSAQAADMPAYS